MLERETRIERRESLEKRIFDYLPSAELLAIEPTALDLARRNIYLANRPGDKYALVLEKDRFVIVPSWHPLNTTSKTANSSQYGTGSMETLTLEPVLGKKGEVSSANIVLLKERMDRLFSRALPSRGLELPIDQSTYTKGIIDFLSISSGEVLVNGSEIGRGSVRVSIGPGLGKFGKSAIGVDIDASVEAYFSRSYFPERAYFGSGLILSAGPNQRLQPFKGKHSSHYGEAGDIGLMAKKLGADDALIFAPFYSGDKSSFSYLPSYDGDQARLLLEMSKLAIANGLGAEVMAVRYDGTILLPPMDVNRLGGKTAEYIFEYMAPGMGLKTELSCFSLKQVIDGEIVGLFFAGNAARVAAIGQIKLHDSKGQKLFDLKLGVPEVVYKIINQYEKETARELPPSHSSLLTPVDLESGNKARQILNDIYKSWMS